MKALSHWLEHKGHTPKSSSQHFDEAFFEQVLETGKIEEGRLIRKFFKRTSQPLKQDWMVSMVKGLINGLPFTLLTKLGLSTLLRPKTSGWKRSKDSIQELIQMREQERKEVLQKNNTESHG